MPKKTFKKKHNGFKSYSTFQKIEYVEWTNKQGTITNQYYIEAIVMSDNKTLNNFRVFKCNEYGIFNILISQYEKTLTEARKRCKAK